MAEMTVQDLAKEVGIAVDALLTKLEEAGIKATSADSAISDEDKLQLLRHLRTGSGSVKLSTSGDKRISVPSRKRSQLKVSGQRGAPTRTVNVEVRKRRTFVRRDPEADEAAAAAEQEAAARQAEEEKARLEAEAAEQRAAEEQATAEAEAKAKAEEEARLAAEQEAAEKAAAEAKVDEAPKADETPAAEAPAEPVAKDDAPATEAASGEAKPAETESAEKSPEAPAEAAGPKRRVIADELARGELEAARRRAAENLRRASKAPPPPPQQQRNKQEEEQRRREELHVAKGKAGRRRKSGRSPSRVRVTTEHGFARPTAPVVREIEVPEAITVGDLAQRMAIKATDLIREMMKMGEMATINQVLDQDTATLLVEEMGHNVRRTSEGDREESLIQGAVGASDDTAEKQPRPPVVTIMGHVDHGKTSLLDYIRKSRVAAGEAGGITQHIGAYHVETPNGIVTFLDTPGHAAFTKMRARGAQATDVVVLVVAADDGLMPQTKEAIDHGRAAGVPMVVAVTKCDKEDADPERVRNELSQEQVIPEEWGGDYQFINVSAHTGEGVDSLLEAILLQSEVLELRAAVDAPAKGVVVESSLEKGRGPVATVLVKEGTLSKGDVIIAGANFGRVRALFDETGTQVQSIGPSMPAEVLGLSGTPEAGDEVLAVADEKKARELVGLRESKQREKRQMDLAKERRTAMMASLSEGGLKQLAIMIKGDVQGSVEALSDAIANIPTQEVSVKVVSSNVGGISESDIDLAAASNALVIGFNVRADAKARKSAQESGVDVRYYSVIYDVMDDMRDAVSGLLGTETKEQIVGTAEVREVFEASKWGQVAGCLVVEGQVRRGLPIRVLRDNVVIYEGELESLRRHKDDVQKVDAGTECGIAVKNYNDVRAGDNIEVFERIEVQRKVVETAEA
ncbi:translation initiation factor IF-2 [Abyssibacter sp.]|jgi:translation initiation factor IF-2|uniref:translation initiation factor IF-2 n=1 Tax=Abyssibacter sp. TaxID=2320200 RepID=UPI0035149C70